MRIRRSILAPAILATGTVGALVGIPALAVATPAATSAYTIYHGAVQATAASPAYTIYH